tara:strand:- start:212 stop:742 length:531 start_codon:yes stop_codon:yes gene_type:complete
MIKEKTVLFQIPLLIGELENIDNDIIIKDALENRYNKLSDDLKNTHSEDSHIPLSDELQKVFDNIILDIESAMSIKLSLESHWCIINKPNASIHIHDHINNDVAIAYYPQVYDNSGDIVFQWEESLSSSWGKNRASVTPKNNMYVAFPGYLKHYVTANLSERYRISVSANLNIEKK